MAGAKQDDPGHFAGQRPAIISADSSLGVEGHWWAAVNIY